MQISFFTYIEEIEPPYLPFLPTEFELNPNISSEAIFIRLLLGTLSFKNEISSDSFSQLNNYSILGVSDNSSLANISNTIIKDCLEPDVNLPNLAIHLDRTKYINLKFFEDLTTETTYYFQRSQEGNHTTAFLHLYRIIEFISYSFPLIYASISREYHGSFNRLKNYFNSSKSELKFFEIFLEKLLDGKSLLESPLEILFNTFEPQLNRNHFRTIMAILKTDNIINETANHSLEFEYRHLIPLAIDLRNRYFHFAIGGQRNIRTTDIFETDIFFGLINEELINWISVIYFEILKASINKTI